MKFKKGDKITVDNITYKIIAVNEENKSYRLEDRKRKFCGWVHDINNFQHGKK